MPSLGGILDWVKKEGTNAIWIGLIGFAVYYFTKQEWKKMIFALVFGGLSYLIVQNPELVVTAFKKVSELLF